MRPRVAVCYLHDGSGGTADFQQSLRRMRNHDGAHARLWTHEIVLPWSKAAGLPDSRNGLIREALLAEWDYALLVDMDMGFDEDALYRLLAVAEGRPIVGGLCFAEWLDHMAPTIFVWSDDLDGGRGLANLDVYPVDAVFPVAATGAAFLLVHRGVFEAVGGDWFTRATDPSGRLLGEDLSFFLRAAERGFPTHVHTGVRTRHRKYHDLTEAAYWQGFNPPPAREHVEVLGDVDWVSLLASTGLADDDMFEHSAPWLLIAEGVRFGPGWLDHAQHVAAQLGAKVVKAGDGLLVARDFAAEHGTDPEVLTKAAREAKVYATAPGARVEVEA